MQNLMQHLEKRRTICALYAMSELAELVRVILGIRLERHAEHQNIQTLL